MKNRTKPSATTLLLHEVPPMTEFEYRKKRYRTITYVKHRAMHKGQRTEVLDLDTNLTVKLGYYALVTIVSEKIENSKF